jgi:hypothetical protein
MGSVIDLVQKYALPVTFASLGTMYLDAKHHVTKDINAWRERRRLLRLVDEGFRLLGDYITVYHFIELNDPEVEAFWFEGRSWTFGDVRQEVGKLAQWFLDEGVKQNGTTID